MTIRIPTSFFEAVKEYCKIAGISPREFFNEEIIDDINTLEIGMLNAEFAIKHHLQHDLSPLDRHALVYPEQQEEDGITYTLTEEKLTSDV